MGRYIIIFTMVTALFFIGGCAAESTVNKEEILNQIVSDYHKGSTLYNEGKYDEALVYINAVLEKAPNHPQATYAQGLIYGQKGRYKEALPILIKASELYKNNQHIYYDIGYTYEQLEDYQNALKSYRKALQIDPRLKEARRNYYNLLQKMNSK